MTDLTVTLDDGTRVPLTDAGRRGVLALHVAGRLAAGPRTDPEAGIIHASVTAALAAAGVAVCEQSPTEVEAALGLEVPELWSLTALGARVARTFYGDPAAGE